jgi:ABC-type dipeptide/oligopeptide/nickel transport system permease component
MTTTLLLVSILLVAFAIPLAVYTMVVERTWSFHRLWELALRGHRLARFYIALVVLAFVVAVIAWVFAFQAEPALNAKRSAVSDRSLPLAASSATP